MPKYDDLTGMKFGRLTVIKKGDGRKTSGGHYKTTWICLCDCGNLKEIDAEKLKRGTTVSCGCMRDEKVAKVNFEDLTGKKFNRLTVVRYLSKEERKSNTYNWLCRCDCGNMVHANASKLKSGHTKSCGCLEKEKTASINKKYAHSNRRMYGIYVAMNNRCHNEKNARYKDYGGRGIEVCDEWRYSDEGFDNFYEWSMKNGYDDNLTIDRIENDKNYSPENCRWITNKQQQNNKRHHRYAEYNGEMLTISQCAELLNISYNKAYSLIVQRGKTVESIMKNSTC